MHTQIFEDFRPAVSIPFDLLLGFPEFSFRRKCSYPLPSFQRLRNFWTNEWKASNITETLKSYVCNSGKRPNRNILSRKLFHILRLAMKFLIVLIA